MITYHNIEQGSPEWFELKADKMSASNATAIGANGDGLVTLCKGIVNNILKVNEEEGYTNSIMDRGVRLEPVARIGYELKTGLKVNEIGFVTNNKYKNVGASPDGLIGNDGGCEIKARNAIKHLSLILGETKEIPFNQIQMSLLITEREWWDFVSFNPNHKNPLFIKRIYPDMVYFEKLKKGFEKGNELIKKYLDIYNNY